MLETEIPGVNVASVADYADVAEMAIDCKSR
jgi:hypothetical protein